MFTKELGVNFAYGAIRSVVRGLLMRLGVANVELFTDLAMLAVAYFSRGQWWAQPLMASSVTMLGNTILGGLGRQLSAAVTPQQQAAQAVIWY